MSNFIPHAYVTPTVVVKIYDERDIVCTSSDLYIEERRTDIFGEVTK